VKTRGFIIAGLWTLLAATGVFARQVEVTAATLYEPNGPDAPEPWRYLLHLPEGYEEQPVKSWPLLFYLHGRSIRGQDLSRLKHYGPPSFLDRTPDFPFVVVSPQLSAGSWQPQPLVRLLDEVLETYRIDRNRVYLTGVSLGGGGAWYLAGAAPERFAAFAPVCGYGGLSLADKVAGLPIWAFHGKQDEIVSLEPHRRLIEAIRNRGGDARMTVFPDGDHGSIILPVYRMEELYDWFLSHRRSSGAEVPSRNYAGFRAR